MEEKYGVPTRTEDGYERLYLDPSRPDSDGDGLLDGEEFESEREFQAGPLSPFERYVSYPLKSHPKRVDSDGDGLIDLAERKFGSDPLSSDTDGDGFNDFQDPRPTTDDTPPKVELEAGVSAGRITRLDDSKIADITVNPYFADDGFLDHPTGWLPNRAEVGAAASAETGEKPENPTLYAYNIDGFNFGNTAERYWVNITDVNGNTVNYLIDYSRGDPKEAVTKVAATAFAGSPATHSV
jgi:hypothetical protein